MNDYTTTTAQAPKKSNRKKWVFFGLGLAATGVLSFFGFNYWRKNREQSKSPDAKVPDLNAGQPASATTKPKATAKHKSTKTNATPKPKSAAASKTTSPQPEAKPINAGLLAKGFYAAIRIKNFKTALLLLKTLKSTADYSAVSKAFAAMKAKGVQKTLADGLLDTFKQDAQKTAISAALTAIGLKYDGKTWTVPSAEKQLLITTQKTTVWKDPQNSVAVPLNMVLGSEVAKRGHFTVFENDKQYFLVESQYVKPYSN